LKLLTVLILKMLTETLIRIPIPSGDLSLADEKMRKNQLATGRFRYDFTEPQAASCKHFQSQNRRSRSLKQVTGKIFKTSK
jgi:hypothetical protein